jgi:hypothetical protein
MTGRMAATSMDGTIISQADLDRIAAEERLHAEQQRRAARVVASASVDVADARTLLDMLGIGPEIVAAAKGAGRPTVRRRGTRAA